MRKTSHPAKVRHARKLRARAARRFTFEGVNRAMAAHLTNYDELASYPVLDAIAHNNALIQRLKGSAK